MPHHLGPLMCVHVQVYNYTHECGILEKIMRERRQTEIDSVYRVHSKQTDRYGWYKAPLYWVKNTSSTVRLATVRILSMESTAIYGETRCTHMYIEEQVHVCMSLHVLYK